MQEVKGRADRLSQQLAVSICVSFLPVPGRSTQGGCVYLCAVLFSSAASLCSVCTRGCSSHSCCLSPSLGEGPALLWAVISSVSPSVPCKLQP